MDMMLTVLAAGCGAAGAWMLYLASPQQQWRAVGARAGRLKWLPGVVLGMLSLALLLSLMGSGAAFFTWLTIVMLVWSAAPFLGLWRARRRGGAP